MIQRGSTAKGRWLRALRFAFPYRAAVAVLLLLTVVLAALNAAEPLVLKFIFDHLADGRGTHFLLWGVGLLVAVGLGRELINAISNWLTWHTRLGLHYALLEATVERLHRLPLGYHRTEGVGAIISRLDRSIQGFIGAVSQILFNVFPAIIYLVIAVVVMMQLNWKLALIVLFFSPIPAFLAAVAAPEQTRREQSLMDQWSKIYSRFNEVLSGILTVRSFAMEDAEKSRFLKDVSVANRLVVRGVGIDTAFGSATNLAILMARLTATAIGATMVMDGEMTIGTLVAFLGYVGGLFGPVQGLSGIYQTMQKASVSLDQIFSFLDLQEHLSDKPGAEDVDGVRGEVQFEKVKFNYGDPNRPLLDGINLTVKAGETLAIVGPSGAGKTTMMAMVMRFYDPLEGRILLDGKDLRRLKQTSLRRHIGVVLQDPLLFNDTIRNNIAYGKPNATISEVEAAARAANAHEFILRTPEQYDTMVGERGSRLSVGERQRITIARALIKNPPIIILDEATSSLDAESESLVQDALDRLMKDRTTFVIAHRLSTVVRADRIIVLKDGRIDEMGSHRELMQLGGYYAMLVKRQTRGFIQNEGEWSLVL